MPTPASESPEAFGSPVPAYSVCEAASYVSVPIAFEPKPADTNVHFGFPASALSLRHTPPPAAPIHTRHDFTSHERGSTAIAVARPETWKSEAWLSKKFNTAGCTPVFGPASYQPFFECFDRPLMWFE